MKKKFQTKINIINAPSSCLIMQLAAESRSWKTETWKIRKIKNKKNEKKTKFFK